MIASLALLLLVSTFAVAIRKRIDLAERLEPHQDRPRFAGPHGLRYDFNFGCRVMLPSGRGPWRVRIGNHLTGETIVDACEANGLVSSGRYYAIPYRLDVWLGNDLVLHHVLDMKGKPVFIGFCSYALGDFISALPAIDRFQRKHRCRVTCEAVEDFIPLVSRSYPKIDFVSLGSVAMKRFYASHFVGVFIRDPDNRFSPVDYRSTSLHHGVALQLGLVPDKTRSTIVAPGRRQIAARYACIAMESTSYCKMWLNPDGWGSTAAYLQQRGLRVICIDTRHWKLPLNMTMPDGVEDWTGLSLTHCARLIAHADVFVGLPSGLSWLAWALGVPVVMISGFSDPKTEFETPFRVINRAVCNSCWNDPGIAWDPYDFFTCPRHRNTSRAYECTRSIAATDVLRSLDDAL